MKRLLMRSLTAAIVLLASAAFAGAPAPEVKRLGKTVKQYKDEAVKIIIGYRHASNHVPMPWILIEMWVQGTGPKAVEIVREDISLKIPGGKVVRLPGQKLLSEQFPDIRRFRQEVDVSRDPIEGYFTGVLRNEPIRFFAIPNQGIVFDQFSINPQILGFGDLYFKAPEGEFPKGKYVLSIFNKWVDVEIPFELPSPPLSDGKKDDKTVKW